MASATGVDGITVMQGSTVVYHSNQIAGFVGSIKPRGTLKLAVQLVGPSKPDGHRQSGPGRLHHFGRQRRLHGNDQHSHRRSQVMQD